MIWLNSSVTQYLRAAHSPLSCHLSHIPCNLQLQNVEHNEYFEGHDHGMSTLCVYCHISFLENLVCKQRILIAIIHF